jgi:hypothetical protein
VQDVPRQPRGTATGRPRPQLGRRGVAHEGQALLDVRRIEQLGHGHVGAVAVPRLAVGERELEHLGRDMGALDGRRVDGLVGQPVQHRE